MPNPSASSLRLKLLCAESGAVACDAINELASLAEGGDGAARSTLGEYATAGSIDHMRTHAAAQLAETSKTSAEEASLFEGLLEDPFTRYWAIRGLVRCKGREAYPRIVAIALDGDFRLEDRGQAVKQLALASGQRFDRELPSDPGHWKEGDLRLEEVKRWASDGYPQGPGYPTPPSHPSLNLPVTAFEKLVARLAEQLAHARGKEDPANPHNRLVPANSIHLDPIVRRWTLPSIYLDFLTRFSPLRVTVIDDERFYNGGLCIYGVADLIERQTGYAWDPRGTTLSEWPRDYLVIADHGADPYVLDLSRSSGQDAPVLWAVHGMGVWDFERASPSFYAFLESLIISK